MFMSLNAQRNRPVRSPLAIAIAMGVCATQASAAPGPDSAYATDPQFSYVEDATSRGIGTVNMITCFIGAMAPDQLVNEGDYLSLIDQAKCDPNSRSSTSNSGSTNSGAAAAADYMTAFVNVTREDNDSPMLTKAWFVDDQGGGDDGGGTMTIFVRSEATAAPSDDLPYGDFRLDFCGRADGDQVEPGCMMRGYLEAGDDGVTFFQEDGGGDWSSTTQLRLTTDSPDSGAGRLYLSESGGGGGGGGSLSDFSFAFDSEHFLRSNADGEQCFSRDANEADLSVWRYGVYDAETGARLELNSGFPIEYTPSGQQTVYHGYLGYYGLHLPGEAAAALAQEENPEVVRVEYLGGSDPVKTTYSVVQVGGKLYKYTRHTKTLAEIDGVRFSVFVGDNASLFLAGAQNFQNYEAYWDNDSETLKVVGSQTCDQQGCRQSAFESPQDGNIDYFISRGGLRGWSQSMGGELFIDVTTVMGDLNPETVTVSYRSQDIVYPSDMPETLYCLNDCPTAASIGDYVNQSEMAPVDSPMANANNWAPTVEDDVESYTLVEGVLTDADGEPVLASDGSLSEDPQYRHGLRSGRLVESLAAVECETDSGTYCDYKAHNLDTYYVWETGSNSWNQFAAVRNEEGEYVEFDAPMQFSYTVPEGNRYGEFAGQSLVLEYGGFGNLWGIPGRCVNFVTNQRASCDEQNTRYVPAFAIPGGAVVTRGDTEYLVKWLDREMRFARKELSACSDLEAPGEEDVSLPTVADFNDPSDADGANYIGEKPELEDAPRVIHGVIMY